MLLLFIFPIEARCHDMESSEAPVVAPRKRGRPRKNPDAPPAPKKPKNGVAKRKTAKSDTTPGADSLDEDELSSKSKTNENSKEYYEKEILGKVTKLKNPVSSYGSSRSSIFYDHKTLHFHGHTEEHSKALKIVFDNYLDSGVLPTKRVELPVQDGALPQLKEVVINDCNATSFPKLNNIIELDLMDKNSKKEIGINGIRRFPTNTKVPRRGIVVNTGGYITVSKWFPYPIDGHRYLFVNLVPKFEDLPSEGDFTKSVVSIMNIYKVSSFAEEPLNFWKAIKIEGYFKELHFTQTQNVGVLMGLNGDGKVDIWNLSKQFFESRSKNIHLKPSLSLKLPEPLSKITSCCFLSNSQILVGGTYGLIAKYYLPNEKPDFVFASRLPTITSIISKFEESSKSYTVLIGSLDANHYIFNISSFQKSSIVSPNLLECGNTRDYIFDNQTLYCPLLNSFLVTDWPIAIRSLSNRDPSTPQRIKLGGDGEVWSIGKETDCLSGLITIGLSNGGLKIINILDHFANEDDKAKDPISIKLYQMDYHGDGNKYSLDLNYYISKSSEAGIEGLNKNGKADPNSMRIVHDDQVLNVGSGVCNGILMSAWSNGIIALEDLLGYQ